MVYDITRLKIVTSLHVMQIMSIYLKGDSLNAFSVSVFASYP